jgi:thiamine biosynthesis protein ThiS
MHLKINGEVRELPDELTIAALLERLTLPIERVAVERNRELVHRGSFAEVVLQDGDELEIVRIVGGG